MREEITKKKNQCFESSEVEDDLCGRNRPEFQLIRIIEILFMIPLLYTPPRIIL